MNLHQAAAVTGATLIGKAIQFRGVCTDSRKDCTGKLFIALKGENFNGEDHCQSALDNGAIAVLVSQTQDIESPQLICDDSLAALSVLAKNWANQCKAKVIAITGSNGKTTVKNMIHSILTVSHQCSATQGNFNNEIGVPLTLCNIHTNDDYTVVEMGAAKLGDIMWLVSLVDINTAAITNVSEAHIGRFGSFENVIKEKGEIVAKLNNNDFAVLPIDDENYQYWETLTNGKILSFGTHKAASIKIVSSQPFSIKINESTINEINLPVAGIHNQATAACATAIASSLNIDIQDIKKGLENFKPAQGRLENMGIIDGNIVINDSYNANPQSVKAAIDVLSTYDGNTTLVLGDMAELGDDSIRLHKQVGQFASQNNITHLLTIGSDSQYACTEFSNESMHFNDIQSLKKALKNDWYKFGTILVKGSRSMHLEDLITGLIKMEKVA
jgi:UDP-N-acetylmuramoyl-tripeptide--D-alanyl-D-alanine ligase